jgi:hypothetical protein
MTIGSSVDLVVARYDAAGGLDPSFGTGGKVVVDFHGASDTGRAVVVQPDGKILAAGHAVNGRPTEYALARVMQ